MIQPSTILRHIALCAALGALAACASPPSHPPAHALSETPRAPTVSLVKFTQNLHFAPRQIELDASQQADLTKFLGDSQVRRGDPVLVLHGPQPTDLDRAHATSAALAVRGLDPAFGADDSLGAGELRVVVERYVATGPKCPDWSQPDADRLTNELPSDFGCASAANLAAMAVDPHDLIVGRTMGPVVGDPASRAVAHYRDGEVLLSIGSGASTGAASAGAPSSSPPPGGGTSGP